MRYDFKCRNGHLFEVTMPMDSITTNHREECPECGMESERAYRTAPAQFVRADWWDLNFRDTPSQSRLRKDR